jgi:tripartite-type tricarboxylate transporter receptor subunit TctC
VTRFGHGPLVLTVPSSLPVGSLAELLDLARARPGALDFGSPGVGTPPHLASELLVRSAGIRATHVPYRGGGALLTALLGGQVAWSMDGPTAQLPHIQSGKLRALAVTGQVRAPMLPEVPTVAEAGVPGYEYEAWTGFAVAAGTPASIVDRLHAEIARIAATQEARQWFAQLGAEPGILAPDAMQRYVRLEYARWGALIREIGLKID